MLTGRLDSGRIEVTDRGAVDDTVGAVTPTEDGSLLVAGRRWLLRLHPDGTVEPVVDIVDDDASGAVGSRWVHLRIDHGFPDSGHLFTARVSTPGLPVTPWPGPDPTRRTRTHP